MKERGFIHRAIEGVIREYWGLTVLLALMIAASMFLQLFPAFIIRRIIDENFAKQILAGVWKLALWYLLATAGTNMVEFFKVIITSFLGQKILNRLRLDMSLRLSKLSLRYFTNTPVGDIMSRLTTDVDAINTLFSAGVINAVTDMFKIAGLLVSLYLIAPGLIWLEAAAIPLVFLLSNFFRKNIYLYERRVRDCVAAIYSFIQEWLRGIRTVKAYSLEKKGEAKFSRPLGNHLAAINASSFYDSWFPCVMQTLKAVIIALSLWLGAKNGTVLSLALSVGTLAAACDLVGRLFAPIEALATEFQTIQQAMAGIARVKDFFREPPEGRNIEEQSADYKRGIEIENLSFSYGNDTILHGVSVVIKPGEKAVFAGRSGAGKTTLMNIVAGLYAPEEGRVRICGVDPYTLPPQKRRRLLGVVPQTPQIFDGTVKENITLGDTSITDAEAEEAAKLAGIHDLILNLPEGYDTVIGEGAVGLSSGELQLLSLARAVAAKA
ncbi:MAG: ABC transporter ATP-binding protein/permease, partial [Treponema sp.]|nr:ABC transporter ATP-binding protein/permease [Treponema sp.]